MNKLEERLKKIIAQQGMIGVDSFMAMAMAEAGGYYLEQKAIGSKGDFVTAPEISQLFGEIVAVWLAEQIKKLTKPAAINLVELGPGRGTLMRDILLQLTKWQPNLPLTISLVEINPHLKEQQKQKLEWFNFSIHWYNHVGNLPESPHPYIIITNEYFDILPTKQYIKQQGKWHERVISLNQSGKFYFSLNAINSLLEKELAASRADCPEGGIYEHSTQIANQYNFLLDIIKANGGAALIGDYGYYKNSYKASLRAIYQHKFIDIFEQIGQADLSVDVDFALLERLATNKGFAASYYTQADFLSKYGIQARYQDLYNKISNKQKGAANQLAELETALHRLTDTSEMGEIYKFLELSYT